jgi:hypothetical protein
MESTLAREEGFYSFPASSYERSQKEEIEEYVVRDEI